MKNIKYIIIFALCFAGVSAFAKDTYPQFTEDGKFIILDAQGGLCGGVTIVPKEGFQDTILTAYNTFLGAFNEIEDSEKTGSDTLEPVGTRYKYDWGGWRPSYGYKIACSVKKSEHKSEHINCKDAVELKDILHNKACWGIFGTTNARYGNLGMKKG